MFFKLVAFEEGNDSKLDYFPVYGPMINLSFSSEVAVPELAPFKNIGQLEKDLKNGQVIVWPDEVVITSDNSVTSFSYKLDCKSEHFGIRAGDIYRTNSTNSVWTGYEVLAEGYSYDTDGYAEVLWGRKIFDGRLDDSMYYVRKDNALKEIYIVKKRGDYDPVKDYGFNPSTRDDTSTKAQKYSIESAYNCIKLAREKYSYTTNKTEIIPQRALDDFVVTMLKVDCLDCFRKFHNIFSLKDIDSIEREFQNCKNAAEIKRFYNKVLSNLHYYLVDAVGAEKAGKLARYITNNRQVMDTQMIFKTTLKWLSQGLSYKIGLKMGTDFGSSYDQNDFVGQLAALRSEIVDYLVPLYDGNISDKTVTLYYSKPVYFEYLLSHFPDLRSASDHVFCVALKAVSGIFYRNTTYDFKHLITQELDLLQNNVAMQYFCENIYGVENDRESIKSQIEDCIKELECQLKEMLQTKVRKEQSINEVIVGIEEQIEAFTKLFSTFQVLLFELLDKYNISLMEKDSEDIFSGLKESIGKSIEEIKKRDMSRESISKLISKCIESFMKDKTLNEAAIWDNSKMYPLKSVTVNGDRVDCQRDDWGIKGGDIVSFNNARYFFEGYEVSSFNSIRYLALRRIINNKIDFSDHKWVSCSESSPSEFSMMFVWGDYDSATFGYDPLNRRNSEIMNGSAVNTIVASVRSGFSDELAKLNSIKRITQTNLFGQSIFKTIIGRISNPEGKKTAFKQEFAYFDQDFYREYPFVPPVASGINVLRVELSTGCNHNKCTYCSLYESEPFWITESNIFQTHFSMLKEYYGSLRSFDRVFLSGGNSLIIPGDRIKSILEFINANKEGSVKRIESYATTTAILKQSENILKDLRKEGLNLVYWGVESCNDEVLKLVCKGYTKEEIIEAGRKLRDAGIIASVMIMPGLGGKKYAEVHAKDTAVGMAKVFPRYLTMMGINAPGSKYERQIADDPDNRVLTREEMIAHMISLRDLYLHEAGNNPLVRNNYTQIGAFDPETTPAAMNPITFVKKI